MNKVLIRSPQNKEDILSTYLIIHQFYQCIKDLKIYILVDAGLEKYYSFVPYDIEIYSIPKGVDSITTIHKFAFNLNEIFNVDYYFDLLETKESAYFGKAFKAKERFGFENGFIRGLFINNLIEREDGEELEHEFLKLCSKSGLVSNDMTFIAGNEDEYDKEEVFNKIIFLVEEFSFQDGAVIKLFKDSFPKAKVILFSENKDIEIKGFEIAHDLELLLEKIKRSNICITNSLFFFGLSKYMKSKFITLNNFDKKYPSFHGRYNRLEMLTNGKFELTTESETILIEEDCFKDEISSFFN